MKKQLTADRQIVSYESPEATVAEVRSEGVLCASSPSNEGWGEETPDW